MKLSPRLAKPQHTTLVCLAALSLTPVMSALLSGPALTGIAPCLSLRTPLDRPDVGAGRCAAASCELSSTTSETTSRLPSKHSAKQGHQPGRAAPGAQQPRVHLITRPSSAGPSVLLPKPTALIKFKLLILREIKSRITSEVRFTKLLEVVGPLLCFASPPPSPTQDERGS